MEGFSTNLEHDLRIKAYDRSQRLDLSWHEKQNHREYNFYS